MTLGQKLMILREVKGLVPKQVAPKVGISLQAYYTYEADTALPSLSKCGKICRYYGITPDELFKGVEL